LLIQFFYRGIEWKYLWRALNEYLSTCDGGRRNTAISLRVTDVASHGNQRHGTPEAPPKKAKQKNNKWRALLAGCSAVANIYTVHTAPTTLSTCINLDQHKKATAQSYFFNFVKCGLNTLSPIIKSTAMSDSDRVSQKSPFLGDESGEDMKEIKANTAVEGESSVPPTDVNSNSNSHVQQGPSGEPSFGSTPRPNMQLTSDEVNIIIYRYLQEAGKFYARPLSVLCISVYSHK
jgi:hypothetical protein